MGETVDLIVVGGLRHPSVVLAFAENNLQLGTMVVAIALEGSLPWCALC